MEDFLGGINFSGFRCQSGSDKSLAHRDTKQSRLVHIYSNVWEGLPIASFRVVKFAEDGGKYLL